MFAKFLITYFDKLPNTSSDKIMDLLKIFNILLIFAHDVYTIYRVMKHLVYGGWLTAMEESSFLFFTIINSYVLFRRILNVIYVSKCFLELHDQLKTN